MLKLSERVRCTHAEHLRCFSLPRQAGGDYHHTHICTCQTQECTRLLTQNFCHKPQGFNFNTKYYWKLLSSTSTGHWSCIGRRIGSSNHSNSCRKDCSGCNLTNAASTSLLHIQLVRASLLQREDTEQVMITVLTASQHDLHGSAHTAAVQKHFTKLTQPCVHSLTFYSEHAVLARPPSHTVSESESHRTKTERKHKFEHKFFSLSSPSFYHNETPSLLSLSPLILNVAPPKLSPSSPPPCFSFGRLNPQQLTFP